MMAAISRTSRHPAAAWIAVVIVLCFALALMLIRNSVFPQFNTIQQSQSTSLDRLRRPAPGYDQRYRNVELSRQDIDDIALVRNYTCRFVDEHTWPGKQEHPQPAAIVSLLSATVAASMQKYVLGLDVLGYSLRKHAPSSVPRIVMVLAGTPCDDLCQLRLKNSGWKICHAPKIVPPHVPGYARFKDQFVKLVMWNMVQFERVIYMDADTLAVGSLERLINTDVSTNHHPIAVAQDIRASKWVDGFNMGVAVIPTNQTEFLRLFRLLAGDRLAYEHTMAEQGFLSKVYKNKWKKLAFEDNANLAAWTWDRPLWKQKQSEIRVVHYTMEKGWAVGENSAYSEIGKLWKTTKAQLCSERCGSAKLRKLAMASECVCAKVQ